MKKKLCLIIALIVGLLACIGLSACTNDDEQDDVIFTEGLRYELNEDGQSYSVVGVGTARKETDIIVPSKYNEKRVTIIGNRAFSNCDNLKSIVLGKYVTSIGDDAFFGCKSLKIVSIPNSVTSIGDDAFFRCESLESVSIPSSITSIGGNAFVGCSSLKYNEDEIAYYLGNEQNPYVVLFELKDKAITSFAFYDNTKIIYDDAFKNCEKLNNITIPSSITSIGTSAFAFCIKLESITIGDSVTSIGEYAFVCCIALKDITISSRVTSIGENAFFYCESLNSITVLPGNNVYHSNGNCLIKTATKELIAGCNTSIIPDDGSVTSIMDRAFSDCIGIKNIIIPNSITVIGSYAFSYCKSLESIIIPDSVTIINGNAFMNCDSLKSITIGVGVTSIGESVIERCDSLENIIVSPDNNVYHSDGNCLIKTATKELIAGCNTSIIPDDGSVTSIMDRAFSDCIGIKNIIIPNSITVIGSYAFSYCESLESIIIPDSVASIRRYAFYGCNSLEKVYYKGTAEEWDSIDMESDNGNLTDATRYYYSESTPNAEQWDESDNWWHYDTDGETILIWEKEN